jgi:hypothetical protein
MRKRTLYSMLNSPLPCVAAQLAQVPKHIIQCHLRHGRKLVLADLAIDNRSTARVEPTDYRA